MACFFGVVPRVDFGMDLLARLRMNVSWLYLCLNIHHPTRHSIIHHSTKPSHSLWQTMTQEGQGKTTGLSSSSSSLLSSASTSASAMFTGSLDVERSESKMQSLKIEEEDYRLRGNSSDTVLNSKDSWAVVGSGRAPTTSNLFESTQPSFSGHLASKVAEREREGSRSNTEMLSSNRSLMEESSSQTNSATVVMASNCESGEIPVLNSKDRWAVAGSGRAPTTSNLFESTQPSFSGHLASKVAEREGEGSRSNTEMLSSSRSFMEESSSQTNSATVVMASNCESGEIPVDSNNAEIASTSFTTSSNTGAMLNWIGQSGVLVKPDSLDTYEFLLESRGSERDVNAVSNRNDSGQEQQGGYRQHLAEKQLSRGEGEANAVDDNHAYQVEPALHHDQQNEVNEDETANVAPAPGRNPRRTVPQNPVYVNVHDITDFDVLWGRGSRANTLAGNQYYRQQVGLRAQAYRALGIARTAAVNQNKQAIVTEIIAMIHTPNDPENPNRRPGRFLELDEDTNRWYESTEGNVRTKVGSALRDWQAPLNG
jgi:hypothetical protein